MAQQCEIKILKKIGDKVLLSLDDYDTLTKYDRMWKDVLHLYDQSKLNYDELQKKYDDLAKEKHSLDDKLAQYESNIDFDDIKKQPFQFECKLCDSFYANRSTYNAHKKSRKHLKKTQMIELNQKNPLCEFCQKDAYVCAAHCKHCKESLDRHGCYCGLHD